MSVNLAVIPMLLLLVLGAGSMFLVMKLLSGEISRQRLNEVEDLSKLWKTGFPPSEVLTDRGLQIQKWYRILIILIILIAALIGFVNTGFSHSPIVFT